ncbi:hypothetical protein [Bdellovibrio sp. HCB-162]|uniref:hypothetical protein n=1 Tax=Bdellovibrio sp. HCB-162 TaxID=3394234 RepID=UPI0039BC7304
MGLSANGWKNKAGTGWKKCSPCKTWKDHWIKLANKVWPSECSVKGCSNSAELGAHVHHPEVEGERIVPMCNSCNGLDENTEFSLKGGISLPSAMQCS